MCVPAQWPEQRWWQEFPWGKGLPQLKEEQVCERKKTLRVIKPQRQYPAQEILSQKQLEARRLFRGSIRYACPVPTLPQEPGCGYC